MLSPFHLVEKGDVHLCDLERYCIREDPSNLDEKKDTRKISKVSILYREVLTKSTRLFRYISQFSYFFVDTSQVNQL